MSNTSSQDEFAKWAKLRRQYDKAATSYDEQGKKRYFLPRIGHAYYTIAKDLSMNPWLIISLRYYSILPERIQRYIRQRRITRTLDWHEWYAHDLAILVCKKAIVLDAEGMGTVVH